MMSCGAVSGGESGSAAGDAAFAGVTVSGSCLMRLDTMTMAATSSSTRSSSVRSAVTKGTVARGRREGSPRF